MEVNARARSLRDALGDLPIGDAGPAVLVVDALAWGVREVLGNRQVDRSPILLECARHDRRVALADLPVLKLSGEVPVRLWIQRHHHQAARVAIQPMDDARSGECPCRTQGNAVDLLGTDPWDGEESRRLVEHQHPLVPVHDDEGRVYTCWLTTHPTIVAMIPTFVFIVVLATCRPAQDSAAAKPTEDPALWRAAEAATLSGQTQLTFPERFLKAGEAYFSPDGTRIIFQAVETPPEGGKSADFYSMYVARLHRAEDGAMSLADIIRVSPDDSANTCGWFEHAKPGFVIFGSTLTAPSSQEVPGYQRGSGKYKWQFPPEMRVVEVDLSQMTRPAHLEQPPRVIAGDGTAYCAECSTSADGRWLLYCTLKGGQGDLMVKDLTTGKEVPLVVAPGYDGGPFFSPDEKRLCYRSDRNGDSLLQVFVCDVVRDASGAIVGTANERQLTDNQHVNWAPYWHPTGTHLIYASSEIGHSNYEIFAVDSPQATDGKGSQPARRRVTFAEGADVLPVYDGSGKRMLWTSQRGAGRSSQLWIADVVAPPAASGGAGR